MSKWDETLSSINTYASDQKKQKINSEITVAVFDDYAGTDRTELLRDDVDAKKFMPIATHEAMPRGGTPLYDAVGDIERMIRYKNPEKAVIVIVTDGQENSSREVTALQAKAIIREWKSKKYQVVFLGADFNQDRQAGSVGVHINQTINVTRGYYGHTLAELSGKSALYASGMSADVSFSAEDKAKAMGLSNTVTTAGTTK
jgi:hypothetical protein